MLTHKAMGFLILKRKLFIQIKHHVDFQSAQGINL